MAPAALCAILLASLPVAAQTRSAPVAQAPLAAAAAAATSLPAPLVPSASPRLLLGPAPSVRLTPAPSRTLKILMTAAESVPYAKTGGLADVVDAVSRGLAARGHEVTLVMPKYLQLDASMHHF